MNDIGVGDAVEGGQIAVTVVARRAVGRALQLIAVVHAKLVGRADDDPVIEVPARVVGIVVVGPPPEALALVSCPRSS